MAKWLVTIDEEGVQTQFGLGSGDMEQNAKDEKAFNKENLANKAKVIFTFEQGRAPNDGYRDKDSLSSIQKRLKGDFYKKRGAFNPAEYFGYQMRQKTISGKYIEVVAELDADDIGEFHQKYSGLDGAIEILLSAERLMKPTTDNPGKTIMKWIKKLELEKEDED